MKPFIETEPCDSRVLRDAIFQASQLNLQTKEVELLVAVSLSVCQLRECLREQKGPNLIVAKELCRNALRTDVYVTNHILNQDVMNCLGAVHGRLVLSEFQLVNKDLQVRNAVQALTVALSSGSATFNNGK